MQLHDSRVRASQMNSRPLMTCSRRYTPARWLCLSVVLLILPAFPVQWQFPVDLAGYCPAALAEEFDSQAQQNAISTPSPPAEKIDSPEANAGSASDSTPEPAPPPVDESNAVDDGKEHTSDAMPGPSEGEDQISPSGTQKPSADDAEPKPFYERDTPAKPSGDKTDEVAPLPSSGDTRWDRYHDALSVRILNTAEWIDSFFDDERVEAEENRTNIKLRFDTEIEEGQGINFRVRARVRLVLPRMERRLSLVISGDPDEDIQEGTINDEIGGEQFENRQERNVTAALWYTFLDTYKQNLSMRIGAQWRDGGPVLWLGPRYRQLWTLDPWAARYTWSVRWFTDVGLESRMRLDFERPITRALFFRQTTTYDWDQEDEVGFKLEDGTTETKTVKGLNTLGFSVSLYHPINRISILEYGTGVEFVDKPKNLMNNIIVFIKYRRQFWRDWLFFEVTPALQFPWILEYDPVPSILFRFEGIFGKYK